MTLIRILAVLLAFAVTTVQIDAFARGGGGHRGGGKSSSVSKNHSSSRSPTTSSRGSAVSPGTGSSLKSHNVRGHVRKDGTYVAPHRQSNPDKNFRNNWSTKGNQNPYTGKEGIRTEPSKKP